MTPRSSTGQNASSRPAQVQPFLLLLLAVCAVVMTVGPKLLVGALPAAITGLLLIRVLEGVSARGTIVEDRRARRAWRPTLASVLLVALLGWASLTILWSDRPEKSFDYWFDVSLMILFVVLALEVSARPLPGRLGDLIVRWGPIILTLAAGIIAVNLATDLPLLRVLHNIGLITDPVTESMLNRSLTFLVLMVWPALGWLAMSRSKRRLRVWGLALAGTTMAAILFGDSNAGLIGVVIGGVAAGLALVASPTVLRRGLRALVVLTVLAGPWLLTHGLPHAREAAQVLPLSAQERIEILALYAFPLAERPLSGWGLLSATTVPKTPVRPEQGTDFYRYTKPDHMTVHPHSNFVQLWVDLGAPGILLVAALAWLSVGWITRQPSSGQRAAGAGALLCGLVIASTAYGVWQADWLAQVVLCVLLFRLSGYQSESALASSHALQASSR
jgi:hypothetical protein